MARPEEPIAYRHGADARRVIEALAAKGYRATDKADGQCQRDEHGHYHATLVVVTLTPKLAAKLGVT